MHRFKFNGEHVKSQNCWDFFFRFPPFHRLNLFAASLFLICCYWRTWTLQQIEFTIAIVSMPGVSDIQPICVIALDLAQCNWTMEWSALVVSVTLFDSIKKKQWPIRRTEKDNRKERTDQMNANIPLRRKEHTFFIHSC